MAHILVEFGGRFLNWSTVTDSPISYLMDLPELKRYLLREYGYEGVRDLPQRLEAVKARGTSSQMGTTKKDILGSNRAGPKEKRVKTEAEMIALYGGENPDVKPVAPLDAEKPLVIKHVVRDVGLLWNVTEVLSVRDGVAFVVAHEPELGDIHLLIDLESGKIMNQGFRDLIVCNA